MNYSQETLQKLEPQSAFFIGFDSDGCVFDSMEIKQKECFCPNNIKYWDLQPIAKYVREAVEFVNLYSKWRGSNRFPALIKVLDLLGERAEVLKRGFQVPAVDPLREWVNSGTPLGNDSLAKAVKNTGDPVLKRTLDWSCAINQDIEELARGIPPFPYVRESMEKIKGRADAICVSQTPTEAIEREWVENNLLQYVRVIAGQEYGAKTEHLQLTTSGKYPSNHVLMVGDAIGDLKAAKSIGALFFPINPGAEEDSWRRFHDEALESFFNETYEGEYEAKLIEEFEALLPETPFWEQKVKK